MGKQRRGRKVAFVKPDKFYAILVSFAEIIAMDAGRA